MTGEATRREDTLKGLGTWKSDEHIVNICGS